MWNGKPPHVPIFLLLTLSRLFRASSAFEKGQISQLELFVETVGRVFRSQKTTRSYVVPKVDLQKKEETVAIDIPKLKPKNSSAKKEVVGDSIDFDPNKAIRNLWINTGKEKSCGVFYFYSL